MCMPVHVCVGCRPFSPIYIRTSTNETQLCVLVCFLSSLSSGALVVCVRVHACALVCWLQTLVSIYINIHVIFLFPFQPQKWSCTSTSYPRLCDPTPPPPLTTPTSHGFRVSSPVCGTLHGTSAFMGCACGAATSILSWYINYWLTYSASHSCC